MLRYLPRAASLALLVSVAACVAPPAAPPPAPPPPPAPLPAPTPTPSVAYTGDWRDWPLTPGNWSYRPDAGGSTASFGPAGRDAELTLRCDRPARVVYLARRGVAPMATPATLRTSSLTRQVAMQPAGGSPGYLTAALSPADGLLDAMGFSRGRFVIEQAGLPTLVVPAWAEIERVTEDCRS